MSERDRENLSAEELEAKSAHVPPAAAALNVLSDDSAAVTDAEQSSDVPESNE